MVRAYESKEEAAKEVGKFGKISKVLGPTFVGVDTISRVSDGEAVPVALGKALLTNAAFNMIPGGIVGGIAAIAGLEAIKAMPTIANAVEQKSARMGQKGMVFGGADKFVGNEAQGNMMMQGLSQMDAASNHGLRQVMNHARGAHTTY